MPEMPRVAMGGGVSFSRLVYGLWRLGDDADTSPARVQAKVEACLAQGITTMDHADIYGGYQGEAIFGAALKAAPGLRERIEIVTKCDIVAPMGRHAGAPVKYYDTTPAHLTASVDHSLRAMGTERVEMLLLHRPDPLMEADATGAALDALVASGKVRAVGVSNFRPWDVDLLQSRMQTQLATNQIEVSLGALDPLVNGDLAEAQRQRRPVMAWSPLGGGALMASARPALTEELRAQAAAAGVDMAAVAVAWLLAHPALILPVMGTNTLDRIARLSDALSVPMNRPEWFKLYQAAQGHEVP